MIDETRFNRSTLDRMVVLRRHLKQTQGVTVHLGDPDAVQKMIRLSEASDDQLIRQLGLELALAATQQQPQDRRSTRLNSSHVRNSYAVFCLKKKKNVIYPTRLLPKVRTEVFPSYMRVFLFPSTIPTLPRSTHEQTRSQPIVCYRE